ncbi:Putative acyl-CoA synthetase YngI [Geodia barretti]|uniref:Medium-chain acyl-CoA ligase ACSF2, mitochondrial n=1 Tax=Geodia barretti TaxID=519541 RepID=A0AA35QTE1_GEOBA|nr:Putative acyl-CoA synthetase YngI [Geodia barretti]
MYQGRRWSFSEFRAEVDRVARALINLGVQPGDKVSLWMPNRAEWLFLFGAVAKIGAVLVPINTRFRTTDMEYLVKHSDSTTLILMDRSGPVSFLDMLREVAPEALRNVVVLGADRPAGSIAWDAMLAGADEVKAEELAQREAAVSPDDTFLLMYTSGTTGFPKGVMHCHNPIRTITDAANRMAVSPRDVILMYLPLFHCFGLYEGPLMSWVTGARIVLTTMFDAGEVLSLLESERATVMNGFDTHFFDLTHHPDVDHIDRSSLRTILLAVGMASSEPTARLTQEKLCPSLSAWGMTEVGVGATRSFLDAPEDDRCVESGHALPGYEFKVIDPETGAMQPASTIGELCVRGYALMQGYYKRPGGHGGSHRRRRLVPHRRRRHHARRRQHPFHGPLQGRTQGRRRKRRPHRGRGVPPRAPRGQQGPGDRRPGPAPHRGRLRLCGRRAGPGHHRRRPWRFLPRENGQLQNTPPSGPDGRLPHDLQRQGPKIPAPPDGRRNPGPWRLATPFNPQGHSVFQNVIVPRFP